MIFDKEIAGFSVDLILLQSALSGIVALQTASALKRLIDLIYNFLKGRSFFKQVNSLIRKDLVLFYLY